MEGSGPAIRFESVEVRYSELVYGLRGVSLSFQRGEFAFLCGPTGSGKSTLLKLLTREAVCTGGRVWLNGRDMADVRRGEIPKLRRNMGVVPQDFGLLPNKRVWENVIYAMRAIGVSRRDARKAVPDILERVNILQRADAFPSELSRGEQQRVAIGRALINNPPLLLADEPTGNLDPEQSIEIVDLLAQLNLRGTTVLVATHDMSIVEHLQKRVVRLEYGLVVSDDVPSGASKILDPSRVAWMAQETQSATAAPSEPEAGAPDETEVVDEPTSETSGEVEAVEQAEPDPEAKPSA